MVRKVEKLKALTPAGDTFKATALEWCEMKLDSWSSHYAIREKRNLEKDLFPYFAARRIGRGTPGIDHGGPIVRAALQLAPMLFQRPGELRAAA